MNWSLAAYSALAWAAQPLLRRKLRRRAQAEPGYGESVGERFGRYAPADLGRDGAGHWVWVHAVSLGETRAAALLIAELRASLPGMRLLLTNGTATGRAEGRKLLQPGDVQVWQPWDSPQAVRRFLRQFRPAVGVLMETEIWPNLVAGCHQAGVPLVVIAGALGEGTEALYALGVTSMVSLVPGPMTLEAAMAASPALIADAAERVLRLFLAADPQQA
jgi:3-deoxy-D-manno-octulosonic-acid transferase